MLKLTAGLELGVGRVTEENCEGHLGVLYCVQQQQNGGCTKL